MLFPIDSGNYVWSRNMGANDLAGLKLCCNTRADNFMIKNTDINNFYFICMSVI